MPLLLKNNSLLSTSDTNARVLHELEANLFSYNNSLRDKIIRVSFRGLEPQAADSAFRRHNGIYSESFADTDCVRWSNNGNNVAWSVVFMVLYAYTKQVVRTNNANTFLRSFFVKEDDGIKLLSNYSLFRLESADAVAKGFEQNSFQSFLRHLPYRQYNELLIPVFRYGDDELISRVSYKILYGCSEDEDAMLFRKAVLNKLLSLSDTDQADVWHDAVNYGLDDESITLKAHEVSMFTDEYPDMELIEVIDHLGNDLSEFRDMKGFKGIIASVTKDEKMYILYPDRRIRIHTSPVKEHTVCTMSDGSIVHTVVTVNSIYRFRENKMENELDEQEEA